MLNNMIQVDDNLFKIEDTYYLKKEGVYIPLYSEDENTISDKVFFIWKDNVDRKVFNLGSPKYDIFFRDICEMVALIEKGKLQSFFGSKLLQELDYNRFKIMMKIMIGKEYIEKAKPAVVTVKPPVAEVDDVFSGLEKMFVGNEEMKDTEEF